MPDVQEVFRMATQKVRPEPGFVDRQFKQQRRRNRSRKIGALAIAAVLGLVAVVVAIRAMDDEATTQPGGQGTGATEIPTDQSIPPLPSGSLEPGRYVFTSSDAGLDASYRISIDVPDGYEGFAGWGAFKSGMNDTAVFTVADIADVYADTCQWVGTKLGPSAVSSADALAAALASQDGIRVSAPIDVTLGGFTGTHIERKVPAGTNLSECDEGELRVYLFSDGTQRADLPGQVTLVWVLDVDGVPLMIEASLEPGTSGQARAELVRMVESVQIDPR